MIRDLLERIVLKNNIIHYSRQGYQRLWESVDDRLPLQQLARSKPRMKVRELFSFAGSMERAQQAALQQV